VRQIAEHLDDRFQLLTSRLRTVPQRHQTLEAALEWSHDLLSDKERTLLRRLAVFAGGWTLEAAEAVCGGDGLDPGEALDLLSNLADKSLVVVDSRPGRRRYHFLETIRQYAQHRLLAAGEVDSVRDKHLEYFLQWAETNVPNLYKAGQSEWLEQFDTEHDNLRSALDWSHYGEGKSESGLRLAAACGRFWQSRGYFREGREWLQAALNGVGTPERSEGRAWILVWAAELAYTQSDYKATTSKADESAAISRELGPAGQPILNWSLNLLGRAATEMGEYSKAARLFEEALAISRELGDKAGIAALLMELGWAAMRAGDSEQADAYLNESVFLSRKLDDAFQLGFALAALGELAIRQGRFDQANDLLEESLTLRRSLGDQWGMAVSLGSLGWAALRQQDFDRARELLGESINIRMAIDDKGGMAWCLEKLAEVMAREAQALPAAHRRRALEIAVCLLGAADHLRAPLNSAIDMADLPAYNRLLGELRAALGIAAFDARWDEGGRLPLPDVRDLALERVVLPDDAAALSDSQRVKEDYGGLTARERETAGLIAQGLSNREIAAAMTVGVKTVETYVSRILNKLGFTSRVQIATWAIEKGLGRKNK
jgi:DNA-binding CsgD family transcriptional regulator/Flp pilus assembly protein TadD